MSSDPDNKEADQRSRLQRTWLSLKAKTRHLVNLVMQWREHKKVIAIGGSISAVVIALATVGGAYDTVSRIFTAVRGEPSSQQISDSLSAGTSGNSGEGSSEGTPLQGNTNASSPEPDEEPSP